MSEVWTSSGGARGYTAEERAQRDADRLASIAERRVFRRREFQAEATARIKALVGTDKEGEDYLLHLQNLASYAQQLQRKEFKGTATAVELATLDNLDTARGGIEAFRDAENVASAALEAAGLDTEMTVEQRIAEIDAVTPDWPT